MRANDKVKHAIAKRPFEAVPSMEAPNYELQHHELELELQNQELREIHRRLQQSRDRYADLYDFAPIGYVTLDSAGIIREINLTGAQMVGVERSRLIGMPFSLYVTKSDMRRFRGHLQRCRQASKKVTTELRIALAAGKTLQVQLYSSAVLNHDDTSFYRTAITDISELKQAEEALRESREQYRVVADYTYDWEYWQDPDGKLIYTSPSCERITGYPREDFLNDPQLLRALVVPEDRKLLDDLQTDRGAVGELKQIEFRILDRQNRIRWIAHLSQPVHGERGQYLGLRCSNRDISAHKLAEDENRMLTKNLKARALELEAANRELEAFSYTVSHDLRSPLTNVAGSCQVIMELCGSNLDQRCKSFLQTIIEESRRMDHLISTLLNFSRLIQGEVKRKPLDLSALTSSIIEGFRAQEPQRKVAVKLADHLTVEADESLMRVALQNLVGNAWKYTSKREEASIEFASTEIEGETVYFIRDNGVGLDMQKAKRIFGTFQRLHEEFEGTGVGLAIVERIIQRHGGRIWAEAKVGDGATFFFTLPGQSALTAGSKSRRMARNPAPDITSGELPTN